MERDRRDSAALTAVLRQRPEIQAVLLDQAQLRRLIRGSRGESNEENRAHHRDYRTRWVVLADLLLGMGYEVFGLVRRSSVDTTERLAHIKHCPDLKLVEGDITDSACMHRLISVIKPAEVYNLAAMSHVGTSFTQPVATFDIDAIGPLNILEAIHQESPSTRFYQASTSELFGDVQTPTQNENTPFRPRSPYGVAKAAAHYSVKLYYAKRMASTPVPHPVYHESPRGARTS